MRSTWAASSASRPATCSSSVAPCCGSGSRDASSRPTASRRGPTPTSTGTARSRARSRRWPRGSARGILSGATLRDAFRHAVGQALTHTWPKHPRFEPDEVEVRTSEVRKVLEACEQALAQPGGRLTVEQRDRASVKKICNTLEVGRFHENHLQLDGSTFPWGRRLAQAAARDGHRRHRSRREASGLPRRPGAAGPLARRQRAHRPRARAHAGPRLVPRRGGRRAAARRPGLGGLRAAQARSARRRDVGLPPWRTRRASVCR